MNTKILVSCHKQDVMLSNDPYMPIHVGKSLSNVELNIQTDNTGDNISEKNGSYCELTALYWAWKNLKDVDLIGLCHYRRYFDFHNQCRRFYPYTIFKSEKMDSLNYDVPEGVLSRVQQGKVVVARSISYNMPVFYNYCYAHNSADIKKVKKIIKESCDEKYTKAFDEVMLYSNELHPCNMFLMKWSDFDSYCSWLFPILEKADALVNTEHYDPYQKRVWGFMAERLFNVWLVAEKKDLINRPLIWIRDTPPRINTPLPRYLLRLLRNRVHQMFTTVHLEDER